MLPAVSQTLLSTGVPGRGGVLTSSSRLTAYHALQVFAASLTNCHLCCCHEACAAKEARPIRASSIFHLQAPRLLLFLPQPLLLSEQVRQAEVASSQAAAGMAAYQQLGQANHALQILPGSVTNCYFCFRQQACDAEVTSYIQASCSSHTYSLASLMCRFSAYPCCSAATSAAV